MMMDSLPEGLMKWHKFVSEQDMQVYDFPSSLLRARWPHRNGRD
jgi:hypothetical protein